jgi:NitT/TauT family transport system ATP-binding protein
MISVAIEEKHFSNSNTKVLQDIKLTIGRGEFVAVIGPSGAGKSTLLQIISGLDQNFSGEVNYHRPAAKVSYMFQEARLMPWLTVIENVCLVGSKSIRREAEYILQTVGLGDCLDHYPAQLSGGMQRRVALARAFIHQPDILLMDEPFVSLDSPSAGQLRQLVLELWKERQPSVMLVTHNLDEALLMADRILFLSSGPASVILDTSVDIPRPRSLEDISLKQYKQQLLAVSPDLLTGHYGIR